MRKFSLFLLLSAAAVPALAAPGDNGRRHHDDGNSTEQSQSRPQRSREVQQPNGGEQRSYRAQQVESSQAQRGERTQSNQQGLAQVREQFRQQHEQQAQVAATQSNRSERVREWRQSGSTSGTQTNWQARQRQVRTIPDSNVANGTRPGGRQAYENRRRSDYRSGNYTRWTNNWRNDRRYDWNNYRNQHRSIFRIGFYSDPFGYSYRNWSIGSFLNAGYYGSSYWLNDPWQYRLPPAYGPYRWVRYWDDALLVNIYTGQVEDVIHNFFW